MWTRSGRGRGIPRVGPCTAPRTRLVMIVFRVSVSVPVSVSVSVSVSVCMVVAQR